MTSDDLAVNGVGWRLRNIESRLDKLEAQRPDVIADRVATHGRDIERLAEEVRSLKRALYTFALSISASAVAFGIAVMQVLR